MPLRRGDAKMNTRLMGKVFGGSAAVTKTKNAIVSPALGR